jgi:hypothetical protein
MVTKGGQYVKSIQNMRPQSDAGEISNYAKLGTRSLRTLIERAWKLAFVISLSEN